MRYLQDRDIYAVRGTYFTFVSKLYPKYVIREKSIMRVTRNADIDAQSMYDEDMDYRNMMEELIKRRVRLDL